MAAKKKTSKRKKVAAKTGKRKSGSRKVAKKSRKSSRKAAKKSGSSKTKKRKAAGDSSAGRARKRRVRVHGPSKRSKATKKRKTSGVAHARKKASKKKSGAAAKKRKLAAKASKRRVTGPARKTAKKRKTRRVELPLEPLPPPPKAKVYVRQMADARSYDEGEGYQFKRSMLTSHANSFNSDLFAEAFRAHLTAFTENSRYDESEIPIYRFGLLAKMRGRVSQREIQRILGVLQKRFATELPPGFAIHLVDEGTSMSVRVSAGSYNDATSVRRAMNTMDRTAEQWKRIVDILRDSWGDDGDWMTFADIDEEYDGY